MTITVEQLTSLAHTHFPADFAAAWSALITPAISLQTAQSGDSVVARLGGVPALGSQSWPMWEGHGPLGHVLTVDCAIANDLLPSLNLPPSGHLAFFYFDGHFNNDYGTVGFWDPSTQDGQRVLHVTDGQGTPATLPDGLTAFTEISLTGFAISTPPSYNHPALGDGWRSVAPENMELFEAELRDLMRPLGGRHQLGGQAHPIQDAVEFEIAEVMGRSTDPDTFTRDSDSYRILSKDLQLLAQVDSDHAANMMWGDMGILYWARPSSEVDAHSVANTGFTWQCS